MMRNMTCLADPEKIVTQSDIVDIEGKMLVFLVRRCEGHQYCKRPDEIDEFIHNHQLVLLFNQETYNTEGYGDEKAMIR